MIDRWASLRTPTRLGRTRRFRVSSTSAVSLAFHGAAAPPRRDRGNLARRLRVPPTPSITRIGPPIRSLRRHAEPVEARPVSPSLSRRARHDCPSTSRGPAAAPRRPHCTATLQPHTSMTQVRDAAGVETDVAVRDDGPFSATSTVGGGRARFDVRNRVRGDAGREAPRRRRPARHDRLRRAG